MKNILLVNDDGYSAEGIQRLKKQLQGYGTIYTVAPKNVMSAKGTSITIGKEAPAFGYYDAYNYVVDGTPADCVIFALTCLGIDFDLVISGCNIGLNHSIASIWSGTIGACVEAGYKGIPSIAFSASAGHMEHIEKYTKPVMDYILSHDLPNKDWIISVNFPYTEKAKGIRYSKMDFNDRNLVWGDDGNLYQDDNKDINFTNKDGDLYHVSHGFISITPLSLSLFNKEIYNSLKDRCEDEDFNDK